MKWFMQIAGVFVLLVSLISAPAHLAADPGVVSAPMMQMANGAPCPSKDCAAMPDCTMAMPGAGAMFAVPVANVSLVPYPEYGSDAFDMASVLDHPQAITDGLQRPPQI